jgi:hypothetical protein
VRAERSVEQPHHGRRAFANRTRPLLRPGQAVGQKRQRRQRDQLADRMGDQLAGRGHALELGIDHAPAAGHHRVPVEQRPCINPDL